MRKHYDESLAALNEKVIKMWLMVDKALLKAFKTMKNIDYDIIRNIKDNDKKINNLEMEICDVCALIIAKQQPVGSDLRSIVSILKIVGELERIGDYAVHLSEGQQVERSRLFPDQEESLIKMGEIGYSMLSIARDAFWDRDQQKTRECYSMDESIDILHKQVIREMIESVKSDASQVEEGVDLLLTSRYLERLGDHIKNICEWIIFALTGEHEGI